MLLRKEKGKKHLKCRFDCLGGQHEKRSTWRIIRFGRLCDLSIIAVKEPIDSNGSTRGVSANLQAVWKF